MAKSEIRRLLFEECVGRFSRYEFKLNKKKDWFFRRTALGINIFQLVVKNYGQHFSIDPQVAIRIDEVETIFHRTSGFEPKYQKDTPTIGDSVLTLNPSKGIATLLQPRINLESENQIPRVVDELMELFESFCLPYYGNYGSLNAIDHLLNSEPMAPCPHRGMTWLRCSTGVIVATLVARPNLTEIATIYHDRLSAFCKGFYLPKYEALIEDLKRYPTSSKRG